MASYSKINQLIDALRNRGGDSYALGYLSSMMTERFTDEDIDSSIQHLINITENEKVSV